MVLGKMDQLSSADLLKYGRRKRRIGQLRHELEMMVSAFLAAIWVIPICHGTTLLPRRPLVQL